MIAFAAPSSGASATLSGATATIGANGVASVMATANNTAGTYRVTASAAGAASAASFTLTNTKTNADQQVFAGLTNPMISSGTDSVTVSGTSTAGTHVPTRDDVRVTLDGVAQKAPIGGAKGSFSTTNGLVNGDPVTRVTVSSPGWRSRRPWPAQSIRSLPAQQSARALVTTRSLM